MTRNTKPSPESSRKLFENLSKIVASGGREGDNSFIQDPLFFIICYGEFAFDSTNQKIELKNEEELKRKYNKEFVDLVLHNSCYSFASTLKEFYVIVGEAFLDLAQEGFIIPDFIQTPIIKADNPRNIKTEPVLACSAYRQLGNTGGKESFVTKVGYFLRHLIIDEFISYQLGLLALQEKYQNLPIKAQESIRENAYLRDSYIIFGDKFYLSPDLSFAQLRLEAAIADLGGRFNSLKVSYTPFEITGGNVITTNIGEKKVLVMSVSDTLYCVREGDMVVKTDQFQGADFYYDLVKKEFKHFNQDQYEDFCEEIINWAKEELGYDEVIIVERNLDREKWHARTETNMEELYHLDTFLGVAQDVLLLPKEEVITAKSREELIRVFGAENIIHMGRKDRENLVSNFLLVDNNIFFTSPKTSSDIVDEFCKRGFNCVIPPFELSIEGSDGIRCHTQESPEKIWFKQMKEKAQEQDKDSDVDPNPETTPSSSKVICENNNEMAPRK